MITTLCNMVLSLMICQAHYIEIKVVDEENKPIEGVYFYQGNSFWYSDKDGVLKVDESKINANDSVYLSHLSYKQFSALYSDLKRLDTFPVIQLSSDIKSIGEVVVSAFDAAKYVKDAITRIAVNYADPYDPYLNLNVDITYKRTDQEQDLIQYKGILQLSEKKGKLCVTKIPEVEIISPDLGQNVFFIKPYNGLSIVSIKTHHVIRRHKKYDFYKYEDLEYKGRNSIKIYFKENGSNPYEGHLIIDTDTKAILSIYYIAVETETAIIGTIKGKGVVKTGIERYIVEADYVRIKDSGKYIFDSGRENSDSNNRWKNNKVCTTSNLFLKRDTSLFDIGNEKKQGELKKSRKQGMLPRKL